MTTSGTGPAAGTTAPSTPGPPGSNRRTATFGDGHRLRAATPLVGQGPIWYCSCGWVFHDPQAAALHSVPAQRGPRSPQPSR